MKNFNKLAIILFTGLSVIFNSCSSDSSIGGGSTGPATGGYIKAKAAGSDFLAQGAMFTGTFNDNALNIVGSSTTGKGLNIQLYGIGAALATGTTYNMNATNESDSYTGSITLTDVNLSTFTSTVYNSLNCDNANGTLTITVNDATKIEGTFSCTAKEVKANEACDGATKSITSGSFRVLKAN